MKKVTRQMKIAFYKSVSWKKKRTAVLQRDNNECQKCKARGKVKVGQLFKLDVHHIEHLETNWALRFDEGNLITLCTACHNEEHPEKLKEQHCDIHSEMF